MANPSGLQFTLTMDGAEEGTDLAVIDFTLDESLSKPFTLSVNFASRQGDLDPAVFLDREAGLIVWQDGQVRRRVNGVVSEFACGDIGHRRTFYDVVIRPDLWRLGLNRDSRIFQSATPSAIIQQLFEENGLIDVTFGITRELPVREYVVQYRESDLAFIERLAAEEGVFYFHQFDDDSHELVFTDDPQLLPTLGERTYHAHAGGTPPQRHLRKLRQVSRVKPSSAMLLRNEALTATAEGDLPELRPGVRFTLSGHDVERHNRDWQVVGVFHQGTQPQALEEDAGEGVTTFCSKDLVLMSGDQTWRPEPTPKPRTPSTRRVPLFGQNYIKA